MPTKRTFDRRQILKSAASAASSLLLRSGSAEAANHAGSTLSFATANLRWQQTYDTALSVLANNVKLVPRYDKPVLVEGAVYPGVWLECAPHEGYVYRHISRDVARQNHLAFFALQRPDGQLPASIKMSEAGFGQIQMTVPIAATAWELAKEFRDAELLDAAYAACSRWDDWLVKYRNTRGTGLVEGFCTYDTGHDNSPRWKDVPNRCPDADARKCPDLAGMPRLCPDLSATLYGGRIALAAMASATGKRLERERWLEKADAVRKQILARLFVPEDGCFFDLDANDSFVRIRGDLITRVLGEHVVSDREFAVIWEKQIGNPKAFWAPFPLPSIALDDPEFVRPIPRNSWGGASQALTALRAPRWMEHYGKAAELAFMMMKWTEAISRNIEFRQQMDPLSGAFTQIDPSGYSPAALVFFDYTWRLGGPRVVDGGVEWNVRPSLFSQPTRFSAQLGAGHLAEMRYGKRDVALQLAQKTVLRVEGDVRVSTDASGRVEALVGTSQVPQQVTVTFPSAKSRRFLLEANQRVALTG